MKKLIVLFLSVFILGCNTPTGIVEVEYCDYVSWSGYIFWAMTNEACVATNWLEDYRGVYVENRGCIAPMTMEDFQRFKDESIFCSDGYEQLYRSMIIMYVGTESVSMPPYCFESIYEAFEYFDFTTMSGPFRVISDWVWLEDELLPDYFLPTLDYWCYTREFPKRGLK